MWLDHNLMMLRPECITIRLMQGDLHLRHYRVPHATGLVVITKDNRTFSNGASADTPQSSVQMNDRVNILRIVRFLNAEGLEALDTELLTPQEHADGCAGLQRERQVRRLLLIIRLIRSQNHRSDLPVGLLAMQPDIHTGSLAAQRGPEDIQSMVWLNGPSETVTHMPALRMPFLHIRTSEHTGASCSADRLPDTTARQIAVWFKRSFQAGRKHQMQTEVA